MTELEQYVNGYFGVTGETLSVIASLFKPEALKKGAYYSVSGGPCNKLSFIQSGFLRLYALVDDKEVTQWIGSKGSFMGDMASLTFNIPSRWNIKALSDVQLFTIQKVQYNSIIESVPKWPEIEKHFIVNCFTIMESRIFGFLSMSAEERYTAFYNQNKELFNQVPLHYIASMLGMTPETFSRIRKKLL
jgi:CRP-like cAMP-binding protein